MSLTHISLFSGIGGIDLSAQQAGFKNILQVEQDEFCRQVLNKHWPNVPVMEDVHNVTRGTVRERIGERGIQPSLISGGFPCQPFSQAGKQMGEEDDRDLWPAMYRVIRELGPDWVLGENVAGFVRMGLDHTLFNLEHEGYTTRTFEIPAVAVGAHHQRMRVFIVGYNDGSCGRERRENEGRMCFEPLGNTEDVADTSGKRSREERGYIRRSEEWTTRTSEKHDVTYSAQELRNRARRTRGRRGQHTDSSAENDGEWRITESPVCRAADELPNRVDRLRALGNAVVPAQVQPILDCIARIERLSS